MIAGRQHPLRRAAASASRLPLLLRWTVVGAGVAVLFWLALSPSDALPSVSLTDKIQHGLGFFTLALSYGLMFPRHRRAAAAGVMGLGVAVEALQAIMPFGRHAEFGDLVADAVGLAAGMAVLRLLAGPSKLPT